jgi:hypothetical protein
MSGVLRFRTQPSRYELPGATIDPERSASEAARRARATVRLYIAANRLDRLGTLTYRGTGCHDERALRGHVRHFFKRLRAELGSERFAYLWVSEWHRTHGLHAHFAVGQYVAHKTIEHVWGRGFVHIKRLGRGEKRGTLSSARCTAGYISKYVAKSFDRPRIQGLHRYDRAQGFAPQVEMIEGATRFEVLALATDRMGAEPARIWSSHGSDDWKGPPAIWAGWND